MYLLDTNILLEILLAQGKSDVCRRFLTDHARKLYMSDFALHSIGVILIRNGKVELFDIFVKGTLDHIGLLSLPRHNYGEISQVKASLGLDFDDAYQLLIARAFDLTLVTMDAHFQAVPTSENRVLFL